MPPSTEAEVKSHGFRKVVLVVVAIAVVGASAWALRMHYDSDERQNMKSFCEAVTAAVQASGTNLEATWQDVMKTDAQRVGGQVESDEELLVQAVYEKYLAGFQVDFANLRQDCTNAGYST